MKPPTVGSAQSLNCLLVRPTSRNADRDREDRAAEEVEVAGRVGSS